MKRKRIYEVVCFVNQSDVTMLVTQGKSKVYQSVFSRRGIRRKKYPRYYIDSLKDQLLDEEKICFMYNDRMTAEEKYYVHKIFPYMHKFENLQSFCELYKQENDKFPYQLYELLLKAGFFKLAQNCCLYEDVEKGKNLKEIFGLPLIVLKALNRGEDAMLRTKEDRQILRKAYQIAPRIFFKKPMNQMTELYVRYYFLNQNSDFAIDADILGSGNELENTINYLNAISQKDSYVRCFLLYQYYLVYSQRIGRFLCGRYPVDLEFAAKISADAAQKLNGHM